MNKEEIEKYIKEYEDMSLCDLADEFVTPLFDVKDRDMLLKIIYINYAYERDKVNQLETNRDEAIEYIENIWYSKNTTNINDIGYTTNKFLKIKEILERGKENEYKQ